MSKHTLTFDWKQWMGDSHVLGMDWDARGMHHWLIGVSLQQDPPGTIPDDTDAIRRWLGLPPGSSSDSDRIWRRVSPQIFAAWPLRDGRRVNLGTLKGLASAETISASRSAAGKLGAKGRWQNGKPDGKPDGNAKDLPSTRPLSFRGFQVPALEEVKSYCEERKNRVNPQAFVDFYSSKGWKVGSAPMKDWRAAVRTWEQRDGFGPRESHVKPGPSDAWMVGKPGDGGSRSWEELSEEERMEIARGNLRYKFPIPDYMKPYVARIEAERAEVTA